MVLVYSKKKNNLRPFEEAKLYGHNATHALIGYLGNAKGYITISEALADKNLMGIARDAFLNESGIPLIAKHAGVDQLFSSVEFTKYVDNLLERMSSKYLNDLVERIIRDPKRKLGWDDRLIGTMRLALKAGVQPMHFAQGAVAALKSYKPDIKLEEVENELCILWNNPNNEGNEVNNVIELILNAFSAHTFKIQE